MAPVIPGLSELVPIGRGGSAHVYAATRDAVGDRVAVKVLNDALSDPVARKHFERESESLHKLIDVPGVVAVLESGVTASNDPYLVMPLFEGGSAQRLIAGGDHITWKEAARLIATASEAVHAAHERGIWHRDIKPGNILLTSTGRPFVADFGIAKLLADANTTAGGSSFTPRYAAPEVLSGEHVAQSDVYSLAATFVAFVTGKAPFSDSGESVVAVINEVLHKDPPDITQHGVPKPIADLIARTMSKNPADRPATPGEFGALLRDFAEGDTTTAPANTFTPPVQQRGADLPSPPTPPVNPVAAAVAPTHAPQAAGTPVASSSAGPITPSTAPAAAGSSRGRLVAIGAGIGLALIGALVAGGLWLGGVFDGEVTTEATSRSLAVTVTSGTPEPDSEPNTDPEPTSEPNTEPAPTATIAPQPTAQPTAAPQPTAAAEPVWEGLITVNADGSGDAATLREAFELAVSGDTIQLGPGDFQIETLLRVRQPLSIIGQGPDQTTITVTGNTTALDLRAPDVTIADTTITTTYLLPPDEEAFALIQFVNAENMVIRNVLATGARSYGLATFGMTTGLIDSSTFVSNGAGGLVISQQSNVNLTNNLAEANLESGFTWFQQSTGRVEGNLALGNGVSGYAIEDQSMPELIGNTAERNGQDGFTWLDQAGGIARENTAINNRFDGFAAESLSAPTWIDNDASGNERNGFYEAPGSGVVKDES